ncbi:MAG: histidine phosphatase family protein [Actinomycetota bacterium]
MTKLIHLVRHGEVENPRNIWYGRLEGFVLSERGERQAMALGDYFADREIAAIYSSPMQRALQTAEAIGKSKGLAVTELPAVIECSTKLEGTPGDYRLFRNPLNLRHFVNPLKPSWGEPYNQIRSRMIAAIDLVRRANQGGEVVVVTHMTPVLVARLWFEGDPRPPWRAKLPCAQASVTTLEFDGEQRLRSHYEPVGDQV